ncbi:hypothetical protein BJ912DRAFT_377000 [Pholiota molesta]|nr:hypothetical protein BJ912DRAFT_377000 [Pholiota molesta]
MRVFLPSPQHRPQETPQDINIELSTITLLPHMFTTPTKTPKFRLRPYDSPIRTSPGGPFSAPSTPFTPTPYKFSSPRKLNLANPLSPSPRLHRIGGYYTPSPHRMQRLSPRRKSAPPHLNPEPVLSAIIEETSAAVITRVFRSARREDLFQRAVALGFSIASITRSPMPARMSIAVSRMDLSSTQNLTGHLSPVSYEGRILRARRAKEAESGLRPNRRFESSANCPAENPSNVGRRESAKRTTIGRNSQRGSGDVSNANNALRSQATSRRSRDPPSPQKSRLSYVTHNLANGSGCRCSRCSTEARGTEAARLVAERLAAEEAQARLAAQQEEARLQEEAKRLEEERFRIEMERSQAEKARKRAEEERARVEMEFARAEEELRMVEEMRQWAQRQQEERLREMQEEARLAAQRKAEEQARREAERREQEARIYAEREAFAQRQAEMRRIAEHVENSFSERMARLSELQRLEEMFEARLRAELEDLAKNANRPRNPLAEFYIRQAAQHAAEQEQARRQYMQDLPQDIPPAPMNTPGHTATFRWVNHRYRWMLLCTQSVTRRRTLTSHPHPLSLKPLLGHLPSRNASRSGKPNGRPSTRWTTSSPSHTINFLGLFCMM